MAHRLAPLFKTGQVHPNTVKVYLIGSSKAGKTTFVCAISGQGDPFNVFERTPGIDILEMNEQGLLLKLHDVAGHDLYHTTHSFFFGGASALFVYVVDTELSPKQMEDDAIYWLAFVSSGRSCDDPASHIIILGSRGDIRQAGRQAKLNVLVKKLQEMFKNSFIFIGVPVALDLRQRGSTDMETVKQQLMQAAQSCLQVRPKCCINNGVDGILNHGCAHTLSV